MGEELPEPIEERVEPDVVVNRPPKDQKIQEIKGSPESVRTEKTIKEMPLA